MGSWHDYPRRTILTTRTVTFNLIKDCHPELAKLLQVLAYLDNRDVWYELLLCRDDEESRPPWLTALVSTELRYHKAMRILADYSMIEQSANTASFSIHPVIHDWIGEYLNSQDTYFFRIALVCVGSLAKTAHRTQTAALASVQHRLLPHAISWGIVLAKVEACKKGMNFSEGLPLWALMEVARLLVKWDRSDVAQIIYELTLEQVQRKFWDENPVTLFLMKNLALTLSEQNKLEDAKRLLVSVLSRVESLPNKDNTKTRQVLATLTQLAFCHKQAEDLQTAETYFLRVKNGYEILCDTGNVEYVRALGCLAVLHRESNRSAEAKVLERRVLAFAEREVGGDCTLALLSAKATLALMYFREGENEKSEEIYLDLLRTWQELFGEDYPRVYDILSSIAMLYARQPSRRNEAERLYLQIISSQEKVQDPDHPTVLKVVGQLGWLYESMDRMEDAKRMYLRAVAGFEKLDGKRHDASS